MLQQKVPQKIENRSHSNRYYTSKVTGYCAFSSALNVVSVERAGDRADVDTTFSRIADKSTPARPFHAKLHTNAEQE